MANSYSDFHFLSQSVFCLSTLPCNTLSQPYTAEICYMHCTGDSLASNKGYRHGLHRICTAGAFSDKITQNWIEILLRSFFEVQQCPILCPCLKLQRPDSQVGNKVITNGTYFAQLHKGQKKGRGKKEMGTSYRMSAL